jgi:hypothetical protein
MFNDQRPPPQTRYDASASASQQHQQRAAIVDDLPEYHPRRGYTTGRTWTANFPDKWNTETVDEAADERFADVTDERFADIWKIEPRDMGPDESSANNWMPETRDMGTEERFANEWKIEKIEKAKFQPTPSSTPKK